jgi:hypothetical protein
MRWSVEILDVVDDEDLLMQVLGRVGYKLQMLNDQGFQGSVLHHQKYDNFEAANQVHDDSNNLADMIRRFSEVDGTKLGIQFGSVRQHNADGSTNRHILAEVHIALGAISMTATATVTQNPAISEEERQRLAEATAARAEEQRRIAIVRRAVAALQQPRVLEVMKLMSIPEPTTTELGHIVDLVQDASGGNLGNYTSIKQLRRFNHSINSPTVFGLGARHAVEKNDPPAEPMSLKDAQAFAHSVGRAWLKEFEKEA